MTNKEDIFEVWAPARGRWSPWAKPVLFACLDPSAGSGQDPETFATAGVPPQVDLSWVPAATSNTVLVLDLPSAEGVAVALELAAHGYRPVPLYNAVPLPTRTSVLMPLGGPVAVVDVGPIITALNQGTERLRSLALPEDAPPAFILDAHRRGSGHAGAPGQFDNRSISFTTDFPSAAFLQAQNIERVLLVQWGGDEPQTDLAHTLRSWQEGGLTIELKRLDLPVPAVPCIVAKPSLFGHLWYRVLTAMGLRRHHLGGYGGFVPIPSAG